MFAVGSCFVMPSELFELALVDEFVDDSGGRYHVDSLLEAVTRQLAEEPLTTEMVCFQVLQNNLEDRKLQQVHHLERTSVFITVSKSSHLTIRPTENRMVASFEIGSGTKNTIYEFLLQIYQEL